MSEKLKYLWPNLLTFGSNLSALTAMGLAYYAKDPRAAYFLLLSGVFDALDGPVAKKLGAQSRFGTYYDAISDFLAFGLAPALALIFLDLIHPAVAVFYILAIQFRLTRFVTQEGSLIAEKFFRGMSAPDCVYMGILISLIPYSNFNIGFLITGIFAIYPWKLWPKGLRIFKIILGILATLLFVRGF